MATESQGQNDNLTASQKLDRPAQDVPPESQASTEEAKPTYQVIRWVVSGWSCSERYMNTHDQLRERSTGVRRPKASASAEVAPFNLAGWLSSRFRATPGANTEERRAAALRQPPGDINSDVRTTRPR